MPEEEGRENTMKMKGREGERKRERGRVSNIVLIMSVIHNTKVFEGQDNKGAKRRGDSVIQVSTHVCGNDIS